MQAIAIANQKGGVGKTATTQVLGHILAEHYNVLMVDLDPQGSLTAACSIDNPKRTISDVMGSSQPGSIRLREVILDLSPTPHRARGSLHLAPADIALSATELGLTARIGRESVLAKALATVKASFEVCLIDCPPSLGLLTVNALAAAQGVIIPTQPQIQDLRGLNLFLSTLQTIKSEINSDLQTIGILPTFYDARLIHHNDSLQAMQDAGLPLLTTRIGRSVRVAEAAATGKPITDYEPDNPQAENYRQLAKEVKRWLDDQK